MEEEDKLEIIHQIRTLAGQLGEDEHPDQDGPSDAEHYDFQVMVGLANATVEIIDYQPDRLLYWLGYCLINLGLDASNPRLSALMDALMSEVESQIEALPDTDDIED
jgi:hypothetical protein